MGTFADEAAAVEEARKQTAPVYPAVSRHTLTGIQEDSQSNQSLEHPTNDAPSGSYDHSKTGVDENNRSWTRSRDDHPSHIRSSSTQRRCARSHSPSRRSGKIQARTGTSQDGRYVESPNHWRGEPSFSDREQFENDGRNHVLETQDRLVNLIAAGIKNIESSMSLHADAITTGMKDTRQTQVASTKDLLYELRGIRSNEMKKGQQAILNELRAIKNLLSRQSMAAVQKQTEGPPLLDV